MATVGDVAEVISLINKIINAAETARALKKDCLELVEFLWYVRKNLEPLEGKPLSDASTVTLRKLEDLLLRAYEVIDGCQRRNFLYLLIRGGRIQHRIKGAHSNIVDYLRLIPIMQQNETQLFLERTIRNQHEYTWNEANKKMHDAAFSSGCNTTIATGNEDGFRFLREFKFKELENATMGFKHENIIGRGVFGTVYMGWVVNKSGHGFLEKESSVGLRTVVAIKRQSGFRPRSSDEFETEMKFLRRLSHPNLIKLLGYCTKDKKNKGNNFLVYEYMSNGNLYNRLFNKRVPKRIYKRAIKRTNKRALNEHINEP
ncbi:hypothetical protein Cni_G07508 [Canna indica]|uniref:Protein kinase domain-containing protein n=1 Tax=Canna indica TaxID=4628 RepID=A0AAQ3JZ75_9LILI|nr:hypothetical protein Cni_G07508 [Canna indica]